MRPKRRIDDGLEGPLHVVRIGGALCGDAALEDDRLGLRDVELRALDPVGEVGLEESEPSLGVCWSAALCELLLASSERRVSKSASRSGS